MLAYDAARQACTSLLAQQGLRPTTSGGHYAVEEAVRATADGIRVGAELTEAATKILPNLGLF